MPSPSSDNSSWLAVHRVPLDVSDADAIRARACLDSRERRRADCGTPVVRRHRTVLRAALRHALAHELDCHPADVPLTTTRLGRPVLGAGVTGVDFSCSRRDGLGLVAVARGARVGVDIERVVPWDEGTAQEGWLSSAESAELLRLPILQRPRAAARSWAEKEAVLKAIGTGLHASPRAVPTTPGNHTARVGRWVLISVVAPAGFEAVLAASNAGTYHPAPITPTPLTNWTVGQPDVTR